MRHLTLLTAVITSSFAVGCASGGASTGSTSESAAAGVPKWVGSLQPTQQVSGMATGMRGTNRAAGTISVTLPAPNTRERMHVKLTFALSAATSSQQLRWAILPGQCGSGDLPVIGFDLFPVMEVTNNGHGEVESDLPLGLNANSTYHVNVYDGGQQLDNVISCGNMRFER